MTRFKICHRTSYGYPADATESFAEVRMIPRDTPWQQVLSHQFATDPSVRVVQHTDYYGNRVGSVSVPFRHTSFSVESRCDVDVSAPPVPHASFEVPVGEAIQIMRSQHKLDYYDFRVPTPLVPVDEVFLPHVKRYFRAGAPIGDALVAFNHEIHTRFEFAPGATDIATTAAEVARKRKGVCQDFAHFMLGVLRMAGVPARYTSGYIETAQALDAVTSGRPDLIGSAVTHAWVEVLLPGDVWIGLDPTNDLIVGDRHVVVAHGRDYNDVSPIRGSYRGPGGRSMSVTVLMERVIDTTQQT